MATASITIVPSTSGTTIGLAERATQTTATTSKAFSPASPATNNVNQNEQMLGIYNLVILGFIFVFLLAALPRAAARLHHPGAWHSGLLLKHRKSYVRRAREAIRRSLHLGPPGPPQRRPTIKEGLVAGAAPYGRDDSDDGHVNASASSLNLPIRRVHKRGAAIAPPHVPAWATLLYPLSGPFGKPFFWGFSYAQISVYVVYTAIFLVFLYIMTSGSVSVARAGWLVVGNLPLMFALGAKNSIIGFLVGSHYGKLNFIHRFLGRLIFVACVYHVLGYLVIWLIKGTIDEAAKHVSAWAAFAGLLLIAICSLPVVRRSAYGVFWHSHWIGYFSLLIAICFHVEGAVYWTLGALMIFGLDHVCRLVKSTLVTATITSIPDFGATRVEVSDLSRGWRAGQHVRIRALSSKMGVMALFEAHPFTIASVAENVGGEGLVLYVKKTGDWTKRLFEAAADVGPAPFSEKGGLEKGIGSGASMKMIVEGPYGGPGNAVISSFSSAFVVVGGSGITYGLSTVEEIIRDTESLQARVRLVHLIWVVTDPATLIPLLPNLTSFLNRTAYIPTISLKITVHYTHAASSSFTKKLKDVRSLPKHMHVRPGRPKLNDLLSEFVDATNSIVRGRGGLSGVAVLTCGPAGLSDDVKLAVASVGAQARNDVGGVEMIDEAFGM